MGSPCKAFLARPWTTTVGALLLVMPLLAPLVALSQEPFPRRPVKIVVTYPPGNAPDTLARALGQGLQDIWKQPVVIENKPGASGVIGGDFVVRATADGHTLLLGFDGLVVVLPQIQKMSYNPMSDLKPIALVGTAAVVLVAYPGLKIDSLRALVDAAKARPGTISYASFGVGSLHHRAMVMLQRASGARFNHLPYGAQSPLPDVLAGTTPLMWLGLAGALPHIKSGKMVPLAISSQTRSPALPEVPAAAELGYPGFVLLSWMGIMAPSHTPADIVHKIETDVQSVVRGAAYRDRAAAQGMDAATSSSDEFAKRIAAESERFKPLLNSGEFTKN